SGQTLNINGARVDTSAPNGRTGDWLLDPFNLLIDAAAAIAIVNGLSGSNLIVQTTATGTSGPGSQSVGDGDITVAADISWNSGNSLTLSAYRNVIVNANISNTGGAAVTLRADNSGTGVGTVSFGAGNQIATTGTVSIFYNPGGNDNSSVNSFSYTTPTDFSGNIAGGGMLTAYMLVNTVYDLQNIRNNLIGSYALGRNIDASATAGWNAGAGFVPIGSISSGFTGSLNGQGHAISGLTIASSDRRVGLFAALASSGNISNVHLTNISITALSSSLSVNVGGLVGTSSGTIAQSSVAGSIAGVSAITLPNTSSTMGGLVGSNLGSGSISGSSASVQIANSGPWIGGGLVGDNFGTVTTSTSNSIVMAASAIGANPTGGLVGLNRSTGVISASGASGQVRSDLSSSTIGSTVGGLVGNNQGIISTSSASAQVEGIAGTSTNTNSSISAGGLVGGNSGPIADSNAAGPVQVTGMLVNLGNQGGPPNASAAGGLVGANSATGQIVRSYATGTASGTNFAFVGGLVGVSDGAISVAYATGDAILTAGVDGSTVGGFIGRAAGTIDQAYALGNVNANFIGMTGFAGGFVGRNRGVISESYSMGAVTAGGSQELFIGGFTGLNHNNISKSYSFSAVTALSLVTENFIGGFVGLNTGTIDQVYATGLVQAPAGSSTGGLVVGSTTPAGSIVGGLVGSNTLTDFTYSTIPQFTQSQITFRVGVITHSYWDKDSTGQPASDGGSGLSTVEARQQASYAGFAFGNVWAPNDLALNSGYPYLLTVAPQNPASPPVLPTGTPTPPPLAPPSYQINYNNTYSYTSITGQTLTVNYNAAVATVGGNTFVPISQFDSSLTGADSWTAVNAMIARGAGEASFAIASSPISTTTIGNHFVLGFINSGNPVIIGGTIIRDGIPETHWMLATAVTADGKIVANDPWTGGQVIIDPGTGSVVHPPNFPLPSFKMDRFQTVTIR
ncbi:MAG TPA: hypothetical protein VNK48_16055, partial [Xanthobacteraceae bacterium]|nr:hypothetical protein [Xanthobacteraceae bacterium]